MSDSIRGSFYFKGAPEFFSSLTRALFHERDEVTVSDGKLGSKSAKITPNGAQPYFRFCEFEAWKQNDGWSIVLYYTPGNSGMMGIIEEVIAALKQRGYVFDEDTQRAAVAQSIVDDSPPATLEIPESEDQAGATSEIPKSDDAAQRAGPPPAWVNQDWYRNLTPEERERYDRLRPYKERWERNEITDNDLAQMWSRHSTTISGWRRNLRKRHAPDMDWEKGAE